MTANRYPYRPDATFIDERMESTPFIRGSGLPKSFTAHADHDGGEWHGVRFEARWMIVAAILFPLVVVSAVWGAVSLFMDAD